MPHHVVFAQPLSWDLFGGSEVQSTADNCSYKKPLPSSNDASKVEADQLQKKIVGLEVSEMRSLFIALSGDEPPKG